MYWHFRVAHRFSGMLCSCLVLRPFVEAMAAVKNLCCFVFWSFSLVSFAFFTGLSSSVVRSVVMFSLLAFAWFAAGKAADSEYAGGNCFPDAAVQAGLVCFDVGFQLSFSAVAAIVLVQPKLYALWKVDNRFLRYLWGLMTVSVAAQLGTVPFGHFLFLPFFHSFSVD